MQQEQVFLFQSGNLALDLLNTERFPHGEIVEDLRTPGDLRAWLTGKGLSRGSDSAGHLRSPPVERTLLTEARRLRGDVRELVRAHRGREAIASHILDGINRVLAAGRGTEVLQAGSGGATLARLEAGETPLAMLAPVARAAAELVIDVDPGRVRPCAAEECGRWFVDTSKGGRRRWCSMATCGNRAKAAQHRRRAEQS